jgi:site-specific recombinase
MLELIKKIKRAYDTDLERSDLITILQDLDARRGSESRLEGISKLIHWINLPVRGDETISSKSLRLKFLFHFLKRYPAESEFLAQLLSELLSQGGALRLFCQIGISENPGFLTELSNRTVQQALPKSLVEMDLAEIFHLLFRNEEDARWIENNHEDVMELMVDFFQTHQMNFGHLKRDRQEAMIILSSQVASLGLSRDIRGRSGLQRLSDSNFLKLSIAINRGETSEAILQIISEARLELEVVKKELEVSGVSVALIYKLEKLDSLLNRIEGLIYLSNPSDESQVKMVSYFLGRLVRSQIKSTSVRDYLKENLHMLTRKIVEHSGEKGDHYIAQTFSEKRHLFIAAAGAGVLTAFTAIFKFWIGIAHLPLFFEGLFFFLNYALGFLLMQKWHLVLCSKQPSFMASALSKKFEGFMKTKDLSEISLEVRKISYSQLITFIANVGLVIPMVLFLDLVYLLIFKVHILSYQESLAVIHKHHLLESLTLPFAIFTGVLLWLSSIVGGWMENWLVFRNIPRLLSKHPSVIMVLGRLRAQNLEKNLAPAMGGIMGNLSIAFFLATPIIIGKITGLPIDIRHVTLAAGTLTLAISALPWTQTVLPFVLIASMSVLVIGIMNFTVSFYFAIRMAAIARNVEAKYLRIIFKYAFKKASPASSESK